MTLAPRGHDRGKWDTCAPFVMRFSAANACQRFDFCFGDAEIFERRLNEGSSVRPP